MRLSELQAIRPGEGASSAIVLAAIAAAMAERKRQLEKRAAALAIRADNLAHDDKTMRAAKEDAETAELSHTSSENQSAPSHSDILPANPDEHRVDWTQSDEAAILQQKQQQQQQQESHPQLPQQSQKSTSGPNVLRKAESKWALRTRLGSFSKKGDKLPSPTEEKDVGSPERPKSPTKAGGLFSRFKR